MEIPLAEESQGNAAEGEVGWSTCFRPFCFAPNFRAVGCRSIVIVAEYSVSDAVIECTNVFYDWKIAWRFRSSKAGEWDLTASAGEFEILKSNFTKYLDNSIYSFGWGRCASQSRCNCRDCFWGKSGVPGWWAERLLPAGRLTRGPSTLSNDLTRNNASTSAQVKSSQVNSTQLRPPSTSVLSIRTSDLLSQ